MALATSLEFGLNEAGGVSAGRSFEVSQWQQRRDT
jgi:hypothetical protein